jgi:hypothetical protein
MARFRFVFMADRQLSCRVDDPGGTGQGAGLLRNTERLDGIPMCWVSTFDCDGRQKRVAKRGGVTHPARRRRAQAPHTCAACR